MDTSRLATVISRHASELRQAERMQPETLKDYRSAALRAVATRAQEASPFYREKLERAGIRPGSIRGLEDLPRLPFLTKEELHGHPWRLLTCERRDVMIIQVSTGTSGGEEIYSAQSRLDLQYHLSAHYPSLLPVTTGDVCLNALPYEMSTAGLAMHREFTENCQATVIAAGKGGAYSTPAKTLKVFRDLRPSIVITSPSWAIALAEEAARQGLSLPSMAPRRMWLTGEGCSPAFRRRVEALWGCAAFFLYGSLEGGMMGVECEARQGYHLTQGHTLLEVVAPDTGEPLPPGSVGELVVTALLRHDSPLLRFRTGDLGVFEEGTCTCGATASRFRVRGRTFEQLQYRGQSVSPIFLEEFLMRMPEVGNWFHFVVPASDTARIKVRCEPATGVRPSRELGSTLASRMEFFTRLPLEIEFVEHLPRTSAKALRVVRE
ncbi:phenylacetate--CoA ligase family protein [Cystobacter ferrugineus]|uniref:Phenylacetate--CoA ligase n=1 Tax=Cystobacter ferrugineus TaxID=83449 RepID=A0A1L9BJS9_9BACT|nr:AMP-binding protein [Cystobacter ferrugineus]OJH42521.1 phenylacetate--CoA ligase [Cystobacter ferrugineus]